MWGGSDGPSPMWKPDRGKAASAVPGEAAEFRPGPGNQGARGGVPCERMLKSFSFDGRFFKTSAGVALRFM